MNVGRLLTRQFYFQWSSSARVCNDCLGTLLRFCKPLEVAITTNLNMGEIGASNDSNHWAIVRQFLYGIEKRLCAASPPNDVGYASDVGRCRQIGERSPLLAGMSPSNRM